MNEHKVRNASVNKTRRPSSVTGSPKNRKPVRKAGRRGAAVSQKRAGTDAARIVAASAKAAAVLLIVLGILVLNRYNIRIASAVRTGAAGNVSGAERRLSRLADEGVSQDRLEKAVLTIARKLNGKGSYDAALTVLSSAPDSETKRALVQEAQYGHAGDLFDSGDYSAAADLFYGFGSYSDSASRYQDSRCAMAITACMEGREGAAAILLGDVEDPYERICRIAEQVCGSRAAADELLSREIMSPEHLSRIASVSSGSMVGTQRKGRVAASEGISCVLSENGTVRVFGDTGYGREGIASWTDIKQIACGTHHAAGLRNDGTVTACGDNSYGQTDVSSWTDITQVVCGTCDTYGLKSDGTVVACGMHAELVSGWRDVIYLSAGGYSCGAVTRSGGFLCSHKGALLECDEPLADFSVCGCVAAGVTMSGTLVSTYRDAPEWQELTAVTVTPNGIYAIDAYGGARYYDFRAGEETVNCTEICTEIAASGTHAVFLGSSGRAAAFGDNTYGQCDVM